MMYIIAKEAITNRKLQFTWLAGKGRPNVGANSIVLELQADGEELIYIKTHFTNIPFPNRNFPTVWKGDLAQFIYDNLGV